MSRFKPVFQTRFSSKDGLEHGNCFTACVASLLGLSIPETPDLNAPELQDGSWIHPFLDILQEHGLTFVGTATESRHGPLRDYKGLDGLVIVNGPSPRTWVKNGHAVIYKHGKLFHDPHPSNAGLLGVDNWLMIEPGGIMSS